MTSSAGRVALGILLLGSGGALASGPARAASGFHTVTPCRLFDSRSGPALSTTTTVQVAGLCTVPVDASAAALNLTVIAPSSGGQISVYAAGTTPPAGSTLNFNPGQTRANNAVGRLSAGGAVDVAPSFAGAGSLHLAVDVTGYFVEDVPPVAVDDGYAVLASGTLNVAAPGVLGNDTGGALAVTQVNGSAANVGTPISVGGGTLTLNADGSFTYNAPAVPGPVSFGYQASNSLGSASATVTIGVFTLTAADDGPAGGSVPGDPYHTAEDAAITGPTAYGVLDNDTGPAPLSVTSYGVLGNEVAPTNPTPTTQGGSVTLNAAGNLLDYTPPTATFVGTDIITYTMTSSSGGSATAMVTIKIGAPPAANNDSYVVIISGTLNVAAPGVLGNDAGSALGVTEVNGSAANVGAPIAVGGGTLTVNGNGSLTFSAPGAAGPVIFTYEASNLLGADTAIVTIVVFSVTAADDGPVAGSAPGDPYHTASNTPINGPTAYSVLDNDGGPAPLSVTSYGVAGNEAAPASPTPTTQGGSITLGAGGSLIGYTPPSSTFVGTDGFTYTMTSASGGSDTATVALAVGSPPTANPDAYDVHGNIGISIAASGAAGNDTGDQIAVQSYGGGTLPGNNFATAGGGTFNMAATGAFSYNPPPGYNGVDAVSYVIGNGLGTSSATITFTISGMIWFLDNTAGAGDGRWGSPFNALSSFNAVNDGVGTHPAAGQRVYVFPGGGPYGGGIVLLDNQQLIGAGSSLASILGALPAGSPAMPGGGSKPNIRNTGGIGVNVRSGNTIRGLDVGESGSGSATQTGITRSPAANVGNLTVLDDVTVTADGGLAVNVSSGGTLNVTFGGLSSANSDAQGLALSSSGGTFTVPGPTNVTNSTSTGLSLGSNTASITFAALNVANSGTNAAGLGATGNSGTITSSSGTIATGSGRAVNVDGGAGTTPLAMTLTAVTSSGGSQPGITLKKTSGSFTIAGTGAAGSGGTISNKTGDTDGVSLTNATDVSLNWMTISDNTRHGVFAQGVNGFVLASSTIQNNGDNDANDESGVYLTNLAGTAPAGAHPARSTATPSPARQPMWARASASRATTPPRSRRRSATTWCRARGSRASRSPARSPERRPRR